jgi:hypothetical protein
MLEEGMLCILLVFRLCVDDVYWTCLGEVSGENCNPTSVFTSSRRCRHRELVTGVVVFPALRTQVTIIYSTYVAF